MKPVTTEFTNQVFKLSGGTDENDLPIQRMIEPDGSITLTSSWELTDDERQQIADGAKINLVIWGSAHPPVALEVN